MNDRVFTAHVPLDLADKVDEMAALLDRPRGWVIKQALSDWVVQEEERLRLTRLALDDVTANRVVDHRDMLEWVKRIEAQEKTGD